MLVLMTCVFPTYIVCCICVLHLLYTSILCRVVLFDSIIYLYMEGSRKDMTQQDSDETQPPDVPFDTQPPQVVLDSQPPEGALDSSD